MICLRRNLIVSKVNRGKQFEGVIKKAFLQVPEVSIDRLPDQMTGYKVTSANICDFIVYKKPCEFYIECKSVHGASLPFSNIADNQWNGLLKKNDIEGVHAGIICWFIDKDVTRYYPIINLYLRKCIGKKSINWKDDEFHNEQIITLEGKKKRVFFEYDMKRFFEDFSL